MDLRDKRIAVLGAGGSGFAAAGLARSRGAQVRAFDSGDPEGLRGAVARFERLGVPLVCGEGALDPGGAWDLAVLSPGIDTSWPLATAFSDAADELIGEIELAARLNRAPLIAITGTNGKTTTTELVAKMLGSVGLRAAAAGNIGLAFSEVVEKGEPLDWIVLEVSSFQLETISTFAPRIAVWLNFAPDHMDRYESVDAYRSAKMRIFENLPDNGLAIHRHGDVPTLGRRGVTFSAFDGGADFTLEDGAIRRAGTDRSFEFESCQLQGRHNAENVMVALAVADHLGLSWESVGEAIRDFRPPPHRAEKIATVGGALWVNDSKSTNLHSLESALAGQERPVVLIVGGKNKGLDFSTLGDVARDHVREAVCFGEIADDIAAAWEGLAPCRTVETVAEAVQVARDAAEAGDVVLFSPGTSSFDQFRGYEARGDAFREAVLALET